MTAHNIRVYNLKVFIFCNDISDLEGDKPRPNAIFPSETSSDETRAKKSFILMALEVIED
jgi:hypothetical protein